MSAFKKKVIRCWVDITSNGGFTDRNTNAQPATWNGVGFQLQVAFGIGPESQGQLLDISLVVAFLAKVWLTTTTYLDTTNTTINTALTYAGWQGGNAANDPTQCHAYFDFEGSAATLSVPAGGASTFQFTIHGTTSDDPTDPDCFGKALITFTDAGIATNGPVQASNIVPLAVSYDGSGHYTLAVTQGAAYVWTQGAHDTSVTNASQTITDGSVWVASGTTVVLNGSVGQTVTAAVWYPTPLTVAAFNALFNNALGVGGGNKVYTGTAVPNGSQTANVGDMYNQISGGILIQQWTKLTGTATNTGWG